MRLSLFAFFGILGLMAFGLSGCYFDNEDDLYPEAKKCNDTTGTVSYASKVQPIFNTSCNASGCHNSSSASANIILDTHAGAVDAIGKKLVSAIAHDGNASEMPKNGSKLSDCKIATIQKWVNQGAANN
jgi:mono/diheme cytochrome c family protein